MEMKGDAHLECICVTSLRDISDYRSESRFNEHQHCRSLKIVVIRSKKVSYMLRKSRSFKHASLAAVASGGFAKIRTIDESHAGSKLPSA